MILYKATDDLIIVYGAYGEHVANMSLIGNTNYYIELGKEDRFSPKWPFWSKSKETYIFHCLYSAQDLKC